MKPNKKKLMNQILCHKDFMWPTIDNFYPNYERNTVRVRFSETTNTGNDNVFMRISVWGADDFGMEKDFSIIKGTRHETYTVLVAFIKNLPNPITISFLKENGFVNA